MDVKKQNLTKTSFEPPARQAGSEPAPQDIPAPKQIEPDPLPGPPDPSELPFGPPDPEAAYLALEELYAIQPFSTRLHSRTGLPAYLVGKLQAAQDGSPVDAAEAYLKENQMALLGHQDDAWIEHSHEAEWDDGLSQVSFDQTNAEGVPLYGSSVASSFRGGELIVVNSTLYPALPEDINGLEWPEPEWLDNKGISKLKLPDYIRPLRFERPRDLRQEKHLADRWILPFDGPPHTDQARVAGAGMYRPVWRVVIVDEAEKRWLVLVDAETLEALYWEPGWVEVTVPDIPVFLRAKDALPPEQLSPTPLNYGNGADMAHADRVHVSGDNFVEPTNLGALPELRRLSGTAFFHMRRIQEDQILTPLAGLLSLSSFNPAAFPDPRQDIDVELTDQAGGGEYDTQTGTIKLHNGVQGTQWLINRPGYDGEVIYHEFVHALDRFLNPPMFKFNNWKQMSCTKAIDEGLAFYFACALAADAHWAEFAYQHWQHNGEPFRHLERGPTTPTLVLDTANNKDPDLATSSKLHAIGTWWARLFWALRAPDQLGPEACNQLLFQAVRELTPVEEPADFVRTLEALAQNDSDKAKIRAMAEEFEVSTLHYTNGGTPFV